MIIRTPAWSRTASRRKRSGSKRNKWYRSVGGFASDKAS